MSPRQRHHTGLPSQPAAQRQTSQSANRGHTSREAERPRHVLSLARVLTYREHLGMRRLHSTSHLLVRRCILFPSRVCSALSSPVGSSTCVTSSSSRPSLSTSSSASRSFAQATVSAASSSTFQAAFDSPAARKKEDSHSVFDFLDEDTDGSSSGNHASATRSAAPSPAHTSPATLSVCGCGRAPLQRIPRRLYARVPRDNLLSLRSLLLADSATAAFWHREHPVALGFTRTGAYLLSYTVHESAHRLDENGDPQASAALQCWAFSRTRLRLVCQLPLFRSLPEAVEALHALCRFTLAESLDQRYFVMYTPSLEARRSSAARTDFYCVIESPFQTQGGLRPEIRSFELAMPSWGHLCDLSTAFSSSPSSWHAARHHPLHGTESSTRAYLAASIGHGVNAMRILNTADSLSPAASVATSSSEIHGHRVSVALDSPISTTSITATERSTPTLNNPTPVLCCTPPSQESPSASPSSRHVLRMLARAYPVSAKLAATERGRELSNNELHSGLQVRRCGFFDAEAYLRSRLVPSRQLLGWSDISLLEYEMRMIRVHVDGHLSLLLVASLAPGVREPLSTRLAFLVFYHLEKERFATVYAGSVTRLFPITSNARRMSRHQVLEARLSLLTDLLCQHLQAQSILPLSSSNSSLVYNNLSVRSGSLKYISHPTEPFVLVK